MYRDCYFPQSLLRFDSIAYSYCIYWDHDCWIVLPVEVDQSSVEKILAASARECDGITHGNPSMGVSTPGDALMAPKAFYVVWETDLFRKVRWLLYDCPNPHSFRCRSQ